MCVRIDGMLVIARLTLTGSMLILGRSVMANLKSVGIPLRSKSKSVGIPDSSTSRGSPKTCVIVTSALEDIDHHPHFGQAMLDLGRLRVNDPRRVRVRSQHGRDGVGVAIATRASRMPPASSVATSSGPDTIPLLSSSSVSPAIG